MPKKGTGMELHEALDSISEIRQQMARAQIFRGYRAATAAFSALLAASGCAFQRIFLPNPLENQRFPRAYLRLWFVVAMISLVGVAIEMIVRYRRTESRLQRDIMLQAIEQFIPALFAGGLLTVAIQQFQPGVLWLLPGLWAILFALGIFASRRVLPKSAVWVARYYLLAGLVCIALGDKFGFSSWSMALTFGVGQTLAAVVLYWSLERNHARSQS